jgi:hypothetical protein
MLWVLIAWGALDAPDYEQNHALLSAQLFFGARLQVNEETKKAETDLAELRLHLEPYSFTFKFIPIT